MNKIDTPLFYQCDNCQKSQDLKKQSPNFFDSMSLCDDCYSDVYVCTDCGDSGFGVHSCQINLE